jgi:hypothetical protein
LLCNFIVVPLIIPHHLEERFRAGGREGSGFGEREHFARPDASRTLALPGNYTKSG